MGRGKEIGWALGRVISTHRPILALVYGAGDLDTIYYGVRILKSFNSQAFTLTPAERIHLKKVIPACIKHS